ncbi:MAG TPA: TetR/AcrR family transcriptional regulator, partial [Syntrophomonas sp.]|nr:TetR/AcrR family transcriptional regulator [Syntrophomonas sp.]
SVMVANGSLLREYGLQDLMDLLSSAANDVILSARWSKG